MTFKWNSFLSTVENNGNWVFVKKTLTKLEWTHYTTTENAFCCGDLRYKITQTSIILRTPLRSNNRCWPCLSKKDDSVLNFKACECDLRKTSNTQIIDWQSQRVAREILKWTQNKMWWVRTVAWKTSFILLERWA